MDVTSFIWHVFISCMFKLKCYLTDVFERNETISCKQLILNSNYNYYSPMATRNKAVKMLFKSLLTSQLNTTYSHPFRSPFEMIVPFWLFEIPKNKVSHFRMKSHHDIEYAVTHTVWQAKVSIPQFENEIPCNQSHFELNVSEKVHKNERYARVIQMHVYYGNFSVGHQRFRLLWRLTDSLLRKWTISMYK